MNEEEEEDGNEQQRSTFNVIQLLILYSVSIILLWAIALSVLTRLKHPQHSTAHNPTAIHQPHFLSRMPTLALS